MIAVLAAVLALAGAPANTNVMCQPALTTGGTTYYTLQPPVILLAPIGCAGILLAAASPKERAEIAALNPHVNVDRVIGVGLLVVLHEAEHAALRGGDETLVECRAMAQLPELLARFAPQPAVSRDFARAYDESLPADYHQHAC